jgi:hypothetical protein
MIFKLSDKIYIPLWIYCDCLRACDSLVPLIWVTDLLLTTYLLKKLCEKKRYSYYCWVLGATTVHPTQGVLLSRIFQGSHNFWWTRVLTFCDMATLYNNIRIYATPHPLMSRNSSVSIATGWKAGVLFPAGIWNLSLIYSVQIGSGAYPASSPVGTGDSFHGSKATDA